MVVFGKKEMDLCDVGEETAWDYFELRAKLFKDLVGLDDELDGLLRAFLGKESISFEVQGLSLLNSNRESAFYSQKITKSKSC